MFKYFLSFKYLIVSNCLFLRGFVIAFLIEGESPTYADPLTP